MRKSNVIERHYRPGASREPVSLATFRQQMADCARGDRLRELRAEKRLSREKVANALDVTTKTVYAWENNGAIKWENAQKVAAFYGVPPEEVAAREPEDLTPGYVQLRNIERKLDAILAHLGIDVPDLSAAVSEFERETGASGGRPGGRAPQRPGRRAA